MLSPSVEDYLKCIYKLEDGEPVSTSRVADELEISAASVTGMAKRLSKMGMVEYESYKGVTLTKAGEKVALEILRHHRLLELYLKQMMDYSWEQLHEEAEHLEHHISEEFESKLEELLDYPTHDPHGHPIPGRDGTIAVSETDPLSEIEEGDSMTVDHLCDRDPELLHHLEERGLMPGTRVDVLNRAPFDGPITIQVEGEEQIIGHEIAKNVFVRPGDD